MDITTILIQSVFAFFAALGFGVLFNIKGKNLFYAAFGGGLGWFISLICENFGLTTTLSFFISSILGSFWYPNPFILSSISYKNLKSSNDNSCFDLCYLRLSNRYF